MVWFMLNPIWTLTKKLHRPGNEPGAVRVAGEHSTTEPPMLYKSKLYPATNKKAAFSTCQVMFFLALERV